MNRYIICFVIVLNIAGGYSKILPDFVQQCSKREVNYERCVLKSVEKLKPYLEKGIPEIHLQSYDPLVLRKVVLKNYSDPLEITLIATNCKISGFKNFVVDRLKLDMNRYTAELLIRFPELKIVSEYDVTGRLLFLPLAGRGHGAVNATNVEALHKVKAEVVHKNGERYLKIVKFENKLKVGNYRLVMNDDGNNVAIAKAFEMFANAYVSLVLSVFLPSVEFVDAFVLTKILNRTLKRVPISELYPDL